MWFYINALFTLSLKLPQLLLFLFLSLVINKMGDSDEEYDRRRRDKFRGERNDYDNRRPAPRYDRGRPDRMSGGHNNWERGSKRDYYGSSKDLGRDRRDSFGRGSSPPPKKSKRDW